MDAVMVVVAAGKSLYEAACLGEWCLIKGFLPLWLENMLMGSKSGPVVFTFSCQDCADTKCSALNASNSEVVLVSLEDLKLFSDDGLTHMFDNACATDKKSQDELKSSSKLKSLDMENDIHEKTTVAGFVKLEDREKQLIEKERSLLLEAIDVMQKATSLCLNERIGLE
ncbi:TRANSMEMBRANE GTPASE FZO [Salix viminalis]|uniref:TRANSMEMBRANE GTPASE FZO n=1 Tax=Salix viminalis TaxID=40686 RepID=A0A9Q0UJ21_SALVM|nr:TRANSMEMBRANE GTPASE FZO [Salix viminalis]